MSTKKLAPPVCLGRRDPWGGEYSCDHEYAKDVDCDHCKFGPDPTGLDPRYPNGKRPHKKQEATT